MSWPGRASLILKSLALSGTKLRAEDKVVSVRFAAAYISVRCPARANSLQELTNTGDFAMLHLSAMLCQGPAKRTLDLRFGFEVTKLAFIPLATNGDEYQFGTTSVSTACLNVLVGCQPCRKINGLA